MHILKTITSSFHSPSPLIASELFFLLSVLPGFSYLQLNRRLLNLSSTYALIY